MFPHPDTPLFKFFDLIFGCLPIFSDAFDNFFLLFNFFQFVFQMLNPGTRIFFGCFFFCGVE